jgi:hypothetical protein
MTRHEAHALDALHLAHRKQQVRKLLLRGQVPAIRINVLAEQGNFTVAGTRQLFNLANY